MTENEQNEKSMVLANEWFAEHKATAIVSPECTMIEWRKPDTGNYAMDFIIKRNHVIVTGDVGDAIYSFGSMITMEGLQRFDWHYFINKCVASETGRNYTMKVPGIKNPVPNVRAIAHYVGLQMAIKQLNY